MNEKSLMKAEINKVCDSLLMSHDMGGHISVPTILICYIGEETQRIANASLQDAFASSFKRSIPVYDFTISSSEETIEEIQAKMILSIQKMMDEGKGISGIRFLFISLMDGDIFDDNSVNLADRICQAWRRMNRYGIHTNNISFYGLFRQDKMDNDYHNAFSFVNAGKNIWKNIYHVEKSIFQRDYNIYVQIIAIHCISDENNMVQSDIKEEYQWQSLYLDGLRMPELILTRALREIYSQQTDGRNVNIDDWRRRIYEGLEVCFEELFHEQEYDYEQYIPLDYSEPVSETRSGWFSGGRHRSDQNMIIHNNVWHEISMEQILKQIYHTMPESDNDYKKVLETIISQLTAINSDIVAVSQIIRENLESVIQNYQSQLNNLRGRYRADYNQNLTSRLSSEYEEKKQIFILCKKIEIAGNLIDIIENRSVLKDVVSQIYELNSRYMDILDELSSEYGGIMAGLRVADFPSFRLNQPINEILSEIDNSMLSSKMNDRNTIYSGLQHFLGIKINTLAHHNLGEINGRYHILEPVNYVLLTTLQRDDDSEMNDIIDRFTNLTMRTNSLYRKNSFYLLSSRRYSSQRYIYRYRDNGRRDD